MKLEFSWQIFDKHSDITINETVQWEPCCSMQMDGQTDRQTDMMKLVAFHNFVNVPQSE